MIAPEIDLHSRRRGGLPTPRGVGLGIRASNYDGYSRGFHVQPPDRQTEAPAASFLRNRKILASSSGLRLLSDRLPVVAVRIRASWRQPISPGVARETCRNDAEIKYFMEAFFNDV
jgi:hypothetical protein